jgi:hypothetical protein
VEITCDNMPTKAECAAFVATSEMAKAMTAPLFGAEFDPELLLERSQAGASEQDVARIGI